MALHQTFSSYFLSLGDRLGHGGRLSCVHNYRVAPDRTARSVPAGGWWVLPGSSLPGGGFSARGGTALYEQQVKSLAVGSANGMGS